MTVPAWRPMPSTEENQSEDGYRQGALIRARHRTLMALRWRCKDARDEDKKLRRLPEDWHEWMGCPGVDQGYGSPACTCDQKLCQHPREVRTRERELRKKLSEELKFSFKERKTAQLEGRTIVVEEARPLVRSLWVKTIDTMGCASTILHRRRLAYGLVKVGAEHQVDTASVTGYPAKGASSKGTGSVSTRCLVKRLRRGVRMRLPAWITTGGRALSILFRGGRTTR